MKSAKLHEQIELKQVIARLGEDKEKIATNYGESTMSPPWVHGESTFYPRIRGLMV